MAPARFSSLICIRDGQIRASGVPEIKLGVGVPGETESNLTSCPSSSTTVHWLVDVARHRTHRVVAIDVLLPMQSPVPAKGETRSVDMLAGTFRNMR